MPYFWLSFCDPEKPQGEQFLGACMIIAHDTKRAIGISWILGLNPGGEIQISEYPDMTEKNYPYEYCFQLYNKEKIKEIDKILFAKQAREQ